MRSSVQIIEKRGWTRTIITRIMTNLTVGPTDKHSSPAPAPEIDPASLVAALTLLGGGLAVQKIRADLSVLDTFRAF